MKTYGKEPESLESILPLFQSALAEYPIEKITRALDIHASRSQEFPTRFDIVSLIKRNGKPPLSEAMYITISKKYGEDRTASEWQYVREFEAEQHEQSCELSDAMANEANAIENAQLRKEILSLGDEVKRLGNLLHEERKRNGLDRPKPTLQEKINATVDAMRKGGAPEADIEAFMKAEADA
jgi:chromosome condensin MukBEF MukE localization factor